MKKFAVFGLIGAALTFAALNSFGEVRGTMHGNNGHQMHDRGHGMREHGRGGHHEFREHRHFRAHSSVIIGFPFWWEPPIYYSSPVYIDQGSNYWYYCPDPAGYYPDVQYCPRGWLRVAPDPAQQ